jgi:chorismate dehydratase
VKPLIWGIEDFQDEAEISTDVPRELAAHLRAGKLDVAIIPVFEYFRRPSYRIVPRLAIACRGTVRSIMLFSKKPISQVRAALADRSSLTSVNLLRVMLKEQFRVSARVRLSARPLSYREDFMGMVYDAFLLIGDAALKINLSKFPHAYDLGEEWFRFSGLPFVFAAWTVKEGVNLNGFERTLMNMKEKGLRNLRSIARKASLELGMPESTCYEYLRKNVRYDLGDEEIRGLKLFYRLLVKHKICSAGARIKFYK